MDTQSFDVPVFKVDTFRQRADKLKRKADKLGIEFDYQIDNDRASTTIKVNGQNIKVQARTVHVSGAEDIKIGDVEVLFKVEFTEDGSRNLIFGEDVQFESMEEYVETDRTRCDHCGHNRRRKKVYILKDEEGDLKQVGSSCLKDFTGHKSAVDLAKTYANICEFVDSATNPVFDSKNISVNLFDVEDALSVACQKTRKNGYIKSCYAASTKRRVLRVLSDPNIDIDEHIEEVDREKAREVIEWSKNMEPNNSYLSNIKALCSLDVVQHKFIGILVSAPQAFDRENSKEDVESNWVGDKGDRIEGIDAKIIMTKRIDKSGCRSSYDESYTIVKFQTEDDNILVWFTSSTKTFWSEDRSEVRVRDLNGEKVTIRATVKDHSIFNDTRQTKVSRVFFEDLENFSKEKPEPYTVEDLKRN